MTASRATANARAAARSATSTWTTHAKQCAACRPSNPAATCPVGMRLWRDKRDTGGAVTAERKADAAELPGQRKLF